MISSYMHVVYSQALIPSIPVNPSGSDLSLDGDTDKKREKKTVKDKLTGIFKKGSSSRTSRYSIQYADI